MKVQKNISASIFLSAFLLVDIVCALAYVSSGFGFVEVNITRRHFENIGSTHTYSKNNPLVFRDNPNEWVFVTATAQTSGVGAHSRTWVSDMSRNVYANLIFRIANKAREGVSFLSEE